MKVVELQVPREFRFKAKAIGCCYDSLKGCWFVPLNQFLKDPNRYDYYVTLVLADINNSCIVTMNELGCTHSWEYKKWTINKKLYKYDTWRFDEHNLKVLLDLSISGIYDYDPLPVKSHEDQLIELQTRMKPGYYSDDE